MQHVFSRLLMNAGDKNQRQSVKAKKNHTPRREQTAADYQLNIILTLLTPLSQRQIGWLT